MLDEIRNRLQAAPFRPFYLYLADGRILEVRSPEFIWMPEPDILYYYHVDPRGSEFLNPQLIVGVKGRELMPG